MKWPWPGQIYNNIVRLKPTYLRSLWTKLGRVGGGEKDLNYGRNNFDTWNVVPNKLESSKNGLLIKRDSVLGPKGKKKLHKFYGQHFLARKLENHKSPIKVLGCKQATKKSIGRIAGSLWGIGSRQVNQARCKEGQDRPQKSWWRSSLGGILSTDLFAATGILLLHLCLKSPLRLTQQRLTSKVEGLLNVRWYKTTNIHFWR